MEDESSKPPVLILGLGNDYLSDDGFGPVVAEVSERMYREQLRRSWEGAPAPKGVRFQSASVAGFHLLDLLNGVSRALIIDAIQTGRYPPGVLLEWPVSEAACARTLGGSHQMDLLTTLRLGRALGHRLPAETTVLVAEAQDLTTFRQELTDPVRASVPRAAALVIEWLGGTGAFHPRRGRTHDEARVLS